MYTAEPIKNTGPMAGIVSRYQAACRDGVLPADEDIFLAPKRPNIMVLPVMAVSKNYVASSDKANISLGAVCGEGNG